MTPVVKLTLIRNPDVEGGKPTTCFCLPELMMFWMRGTSSFAKKDFPAIAKFKREVPIDESHHPKQECTVIYLSSGHTLTVLESPDEVKRLRDEAFGAQKFNSPGTAR